MLTDLVIDPFGADLRDVVALARVADEAGYDGVWTFDHLSGVVARRPWSRDPFVALGAVAAVTERVRLGVLVANVVNRHPAQLASAVASLQSLAPGRVMCGLGSGAVPGSTFAAEQTAIGRVIDPFEQRRERLVEHVDAVRAIWSGAREGRSVTASGRHVTMVGLDAVVEPAPTPPIVIGSSGEQTVRLAARIADGVNIRTGPQLADLVRAVAHERHEGPAPVEPFEVSVFGRLDLDHPLGGDPEPLHSLGVAARTLFVSPPYPFEAVAAVGDRCRDEVRALDLAPWPS